MSIAVNFNQGSASFIQFDAKKHYKTTAQVGALVSDLAEADDFAFRDQMKTAVNLLFYSIYIRFSILN